MKRFIVFITILLLVFASQTFALPVQDQFSPYTNATFNNGNFQQQVTAGLSGKLAGVSLYNWGGQSQNLSFYLNLGSGWQTDPNNYGASITLTIPDDWNYIDVSSANIILNSGDQFMIGLVLSSNHIGGSYNTINPEYPYPVYVNGSLYGAAWRIGFKTFADVASVPEPVSMLLLGLGLIGLAGVRRKMK